MKNNFVLLNDALKQQKYYAVYCRCGHVGLNNYIVIVFAVIASSGKEAAAKARWFARVKHNKKNAIIDCYEITREQYDEIIEANKNDPYLKCRNVQEQRLINDFALRIIKEPEVETYKKTKEERKDLIKYKLKKQKQKIDDLDGINDYDYVFEKGEQIYENIY